MAPLVQVEQLEKRFGEVRALDRVSFDVEAGEWIAIMGPPAPARRRSSTFSAASIILPAAAWLSTAWKSATSANAS